MEKNRYLKYLVLHYEITNKVIVNPLQLFKSDWLTESIFKFNEAYSLIKHDVQAPVGINQLKITLKKLKEQEDANKDI